MPYCYQWPIQYECSIVSAVASFSNFIIQAYGEKSYLLLLLISTKENRAIDYGLW